MPLDGGVDNIEDGVTSCFPLVVSHLASARNLVVLHLNINGVLDVDNAWRIEPLIELMGRNLLRCKKLKDLSISLTQGNYCVDLMRDLVLALTPTIQKQGKSLHRFDFHIAGGPEDVSGELMNPLRTLDYVAIDFFSAILSCNNVASLAIKCAHSFSLTNALLEAVKLMQSAGLQPFTNLTWLTLALDLCCHDPPTLEQNGVQYVHYTNILLGLFSDCRLIQHVSLSLPLNIWKKNLEAVRKLLCDKSHLSDLNLHFSGYDDSDEMILQLLENCKQSFNRKASWQFEDLSNVNGSRLLNLMQHIKIMGGRFNGLTGRELLGTDTTNTEEANDRHHIDLNHHDDVNEGDLPGRMYIDDWWMARYHQ